MGIFFTALKAIIISQLQSELVKAGIKYIKAKIAKAKAKAANMKARIRKPK